MDTYVDDFYVDDDTKAINDAIDAASKRSGKVIFSKRLYESKTIILKDNVELYLPKGCILKLSKELLNDDSINVLKVPTYKDCSYNGRPTKYFIYAYDIKNVKITGKGIIDGNDEIFFGNVSKYHIDGYFYPRIPLVYFEKVENFNLSNINIRKSGFWTIHLVGCDNGLIENIKIKNNRKLANTDGIDPDHSKNIIIRNSYIEAADDCIVFKTTKDNQIYGDTSNIEVYNCVLKSTSAALKFGSESVGLMHDINIHDIEIKDSNRGIDLMQRDEGQIYNIEFRNINIETKRFHALEWWGKGEPISITNIKRGFATNLGNVYNITFDNINMNSENGIFIYGSNQNIKDLYFNNINIELKAKTMFKKNNHDLRPCYGDYLIEGLTNVIYINEAKNVRFKNFNYKINDNFKEYLGDIDFIQNVSELLIE